MSDNKIVYKNQEDFVKACYFLTTHGAAYKADGETMTITITGY